MLILWFAFVKLKRNYLLTYLFVNLVYFLKVILCCSGHFSVKIC